MSTIKRPDLNQSSVISYDIETFDPFLKQKGTGVYRNDGRILGVAVADEKSGFSEYYNISHKEGSIDEKRANLNYIREVLKNKNSKKLATNALYDLDWLENKYSVSVNGELLDIGIAEALLDEYKKSYSLDSLADSYLQKKKFKTEIDTFCESRGFKGDSRKYLYHMPFEMVRKYAIQDVLLPLEIHKKQMPLLEQQNLIDLYKMEMRLFPLLMQMRKVGVRIDVPLLQPSIDKLQKDIDDSYNKLYGLAGYEFNINSGKQLLPVFESLGISYGLTKKKQPSFAKDVLENCGHEVGKLILDIRHKLKIINTYLINAFRDGNINGILHGSFYPMKTDSYGTKSGRLSSANPNLQNIPSKKKDPISVLCRTLFIPKDGCYWGKIDYSQVEYRIIAHYANGPKSEEIRKKYNDDPTTDYHSLVMSWTGLTDRDLAKTLNFAMAYFMGAPACSKKYGWTLEKAKEFINLYHEMVPFVKYTRTQVVNVAKRRGFLRTILNRRARVSKEMRLVGSEFSMFNRLIQGSAADIMKKAMVDSYEAGIFNVLIPHLTVHDELDFSVPKTREGAQAFKELKNIMENTVKLKIPLIAEAELGLNWSAVSKKAYKKFINDFAA
jgi:DNA polymerase-1